METESTARTGTGRETVGETAGRLPAWASVLAVVAHPDDESFGLGALLVAFATAGARTAVLCLTHGEASTVHGIEGDLRTLRAAELARAADLLGVTDVELLDYPDTGLAATPLDLLVADVHRSVLRTRPEGLLVFDPNGITTHPDHQRATLAALTAAQRAGSLPVLGWTLPERIATRLRDELGVSFIGQPSERIDLVVTVDRARQLAAVRAHPSQAVPTSALWRRLELLGDREYLRQLSG